MIDSIIELGNARLNFRGNRSYIQGSMIIGCAIDALNASLPRDVLADMTLSAANFRRVADVPCRTFILGAGQDAPNDPCAEVVFAMPDKKRAATVIFVEDPSARPTPREADTPKVILPPDFGRERAYEARFEALGQGVDGFFRAIVEAHKASHEHYFPGATKIMFLSLFKSNLPALANLYPQSGTLEVAYQLEKPSTDGHVSFAQISTVTSRAKPVLSGIIFSFQPG